MSLPSNSSVASSLVTIDEKYEMGAPRNDDMLVRDFGWPSVSPRYHGDHTPESNPDWDHNPLECEKAKQEAFERILDDVDGQFFVRDYTSMSLSHSM